jgi:hypothetical protein
VIALLVLFSLAATGGRLVVTHTVPKEVSAGSTLVLDFYVTDEGGNPIRPDAFEVNVTNPYGIKTRLSCEEKGVGRYAAPYTFRYEGAHFFEIIANKANYTSAYQTFVVDTYPPMGKVPWVLIAMMVAAVLIASYTMVKAARFLWRRGKRR